MKPYSKKGFSRLIAAFLNSGKGFMWMIRNEAAFQQEMFLLLLSIPVILLVDASSLEKLMLFFSIIFIVTVEVLNTAIEAAIDRIGEEYHPLSGLAKDLGSLAVLLSLLFAALVWFVILAGF